MEKISAVYKIVNIVTNECYVGSSKNVFHRWACHKCPSKWKQHPNSSLYNDMQKYGLDKFRFQILCPVEPEHLKEVEQELIEMIQPAYNNNRANGLDIERQKDYQKEYRQSDKGKEINHKASKRYYSQLCFYNGETLTLNALRQSFRRAGIPHPTVEAKKYLKKDCNN